jgi:NADH dehydrogenase FAD-containing subunit
MTQRSARIVVLGAGYAGLLATVRLAGRMKRDIARAHVTITLVNAADVFVERLRLHQLAANRPLAQRPLANILRGTGVTLLCGTATHIDVAQHRVDVQMAAGVQSLEYDYLLYALGSTIERDSVPGVREYTYALTPEGSRSAPALRDALGALQRRGARGRVLVCGAGATGIEAAAEFAAAYPGLAVQLVTQGDFGHFMPPEIAAYMRQALLRLGVSIQDQTTITGVHATEVQTAGGATLPYDLCLWSGGFSVPALACEAGISVNERGQIVIDPFMRSVSHPEIYSVGDAADPLETPGAPVRMAAYTAVVMGAHGADCIAAALRGKQPRPFSFAYGGQAITLGPHDAIGFSTYPDDRPHRPHFTGRLASGVREFFVGLLADLPRVERRRTGVFVWWGKGRYAALKRRRPELAQTLRPE